MRVQNLQHCCSTIHESPLSDQLYFLLEKVSAFALGVFSASLSMELFLPFFLIGLAIGAYQHLYTDQTDHSHKHHASSCSQGFLEQITGTRLPSLALLIANLAITWCHIDHHPAVFIPVVGVSLGAWGGQAIASLPTKI